MGRWVTSRGRRIYIPDEGEKVPEKYQKNVVEGMTSKKDSVEETVNRNENLKEKQIAKNTAEKDALNQKEKKLTKKQRLAQAQKEVEEVEDIDDIKVSDLAKKYNLSSAEAGQLVFDRSKNETRYAASDINYNWDAYEKDVRNLQPGDAIYVRTTEGKLLKYIKGEPEHRTDYIDKSEGGPKFESYTGTDFYMQDGDEKERIPEQDVAARLANRLTGYYGRRELNELKLVRKKRK